MKDTQTPIVRRPIDRNIWTPLKVHVLKEMLEGPIKGQCPCPTMILGPRKTDHQARFSISAP